MKNLFLVSIVLTGALLNLSAQDAKINWLDFEEAVQLNKEEPKKFFIDFYTDWCGWCKRLDAVTFKDKNVVEIINANYYPVKFDAERKDTIRFQNRDYIFVKPPESRRGYHVLAAALMNKKLSYPTMVIMTVESESENVTFIQPLQGYMDGPKLMPYLDYFAQDLHVQRVDFNEWKATYAVSKDEE